MSLAALVLFLFASFHADTIAQNFFAHGSSSFGTGGPVGRSPSGPSGSNPGSR